MRKWMWIDYVVGKLKKLPDGSIWLRGKGWGMVALVVGPPFMFFSMFAKYVLADPLNSPLLEAITWINGVLLCLTLALLVWTPRRIVVFDALKGTVLIRHAGLLKERLELLLRADEIEEISLEKSDKEGPFSKPRLFLKTKNQLLYLVSLRKAFARSNLVSELQAWISTWKKNKPQSE
jgi:hypothetical protein